MTLEQLLLSLLGVANTMGAVMLKGWLKRLEDTEKRLTDFQADVPKVYVTKEDLEKDIDRLLHRFDKLEAKLDRLLAFRRD
jgi:archaellum component FlaC